MSRPRSFTDEAILDAAKAIFLAEGPTGTVEAIADRVGCSVATVFKRFTTKEALMITALAPPPPVRLLQLVGEGPDASRAIDVQLLTVLTELIEWMGSVVPGVAVLRMAGFTPREVFSRLGLPGPPKYIEELAAWLRRCHEAKLLEVDAPEAAAVALFGAAQVRAFLNHLEPGRTHTDSVAEYAASVSDLLLVGMLPDSRPRPPTSGE